MLRSRLVFLGTPGLAREVLAALAAWPGGEVVLVVAQPDKPVGRGLELQPPPVKMEALKLGLPVAQPASLREPGFQETLRALRPDLLVVAAFGQILPPAVLELPPHGCLNVHTSLLPRWRGAAPIARAILAGDQETGVTLMRMDEGLDTGAVVAMERTPILESDTAQTLHDRLANLGASLLVRTLPDWLAGRLPSQPQPVEGVTYARKLTKEEGRLDWRLPAEVLWRQVRGFNPWPGAYTTVRTPASKEPILLKVWAARPGGPSGPPGEVLCAAGDQLIVGTGAGALQIEEVQRAGKRRLPAREFLTSSLLAPGMKLGGD